MDKEPDRLMSAGTLERAIELLLSSSADDLILQFFGGEALLRRDFVLSGMDRALVMASRARKRIGFILSTNGVSLDPALIEHLRSLPVKVEMSIDGPAEVHNRHRRPPDRSFDSYETATRHARALIDSGIPHEVIMVVTPSTVDRLADSFAHVASLGFTRIQVNHALAVTWTREHMEAFARELSAIEERFYSKGVGSPELLDLRTFSRPMLLNCEITVDHDGTVYFGNGFLVRTSTPGAFLAGQLDDLENLDAYMARRPGNDYLIEHTYPAKVARNNYKVGRIYGSFIGHMRSRFPELARPEALSRPGHPR
jgi:sulfatase maturation enzyme AslB (radical SAM superfamily)